MHFSSIVLLASSGAASASIFSNPSTFDFSSLIKRKATCPTYWQQISKDLNAAFLDTNGQCNANARAAVRYAFHDAGPYSSKIAFVAPAGGGADGSLLLSADEMGRGENGGLESYNTFIGDKLKSYRGQFGSTVGAADLIQFASSVAVITCPGGPKVKTVVGRTDSSAGAPNGFMPPGFGPGSDHDSLLQLFLDKGFSAAELAALIGAHTTSTAFKQEANGIPNGGQQDSTPGKWDINFYAETYSAPAGVYRFDSDINLSNRTTTVGKQFQGFVGQAGKWNSAFAAAMAKLSVLGIPGSAQGNFADCTGYLPAGTAAKMIRSAPIADRLYSERK
ncbi:hypothetical protein Q7P36_009691 [Cladosporium allicinum]